MPHELIKHRDRINALIGPIEQIVADLDELRLDRAVDGATYTFTLGGLEQAMEVLHGTVNAIDEYEEPEPQPEVEGWDEPDEPEEEDDENDEEEA